jgi:hypothetical protein
MSISRRVKVIGLLGGAALILALGGFWFMLKPDQYQALSGGIQALGVVLALTIAVMTLLSDSRDRRIDRVLQLHEMMTTRDAEAMRDRLYKHLLSRDQAEPPVRAVSLDELKPGGTLDHYANDPDHSPYQDVRQLLRLFERANATRAGGAIEEPLFHELIARHATWWAVAVGSKPRAAPYVLNPLLDLARWADDYQLTKNDPAKYYMRTWGESRMQSFGRTSWTSEGPE